jgi:hypothetical protein
VILRAQCDAQVHRAVQQRLVDDVRAQHLQLAFQVRVVVVHAGHRARHQVRRQAGRAHQPQRGVAPLRELGTELAHALDAVPQPLDLLEQALRLRGRDQATLDALEEHQPAGLGGLCQHLADGRR